MVTPLNRIALNFRGLHSKSLFICRLLAFLHLASLYVQFCWLEVGACTSQSLLELCKGPFLTPRSHFHAPRNLLTCIFVLQNQLVPMTTRDAVTQTLKAVKPRLMQRYALKRIALFGSVSRGDDTPDSDVDILVEFAQPVGMEFIFLAQELEMLLNRKVDLVSRGGIKSKYFQVIEPDLRYV